MPNCIRAATTSPLGGRPVADPDNSTLVDVGGVFRGDIRWGHQVGTSGGDIRWGHQVGTLGGDIRWGHQVGTLGGGH